MQPTSGSTRAFDRAVWAKRGIYNACSELMYQDGMPVADHERIDAFRSDIWKRSIDEFTEDNSNRVRNDIIREAEAFLAAYGIVNTFGGWRPSQPPGPGAPDPAFAPGPPAGAPARSPG